MSKGYIMRSMQIPADPEEKMTSNRRVADWWRDHYNIYNNWKWTASNGYLFINLNPKQNTIIRVKLFGLGCNQMYSL